MMAYKEYFADYDIHVAQILLTRDDFSDPHRTLNIRNAMFTLIDEGVIPVINENDSVSVDEIKIGDNDTLAALTASLWNADLMIILSDIDGVFDKDPEGQQRCGADRAGGQCGQADRDHQHRREEHLRDRRHRDQDRSRVQGQQVRDPDAPSQRRKRKYHPGQSGRQGPRHPVPWNHRKVR